MFQLLRIEVIFKYNIMFFIDDWYCHFILNAFFYHDFEDECDHYVKKQKSYQQEYVY